MSRHCEKLLRFKGETKSIPEWAKVTGIPEATIRDRLKRWNTYEALSTPIKGRKETT